MATVKKLYEDVLDIRISVCDKWKFIVVKSQPELGGEEKPQKWVELFITREHGGGREELIIQNLPLSREDLQALQQAIQLLLIKM